MVKPNFYTRLNTKDNRISLDSLGLLDQLLCWCNQTIKAIDLAYELYVRRFVSPDALSGRWDSGGGSYLYLLILFTNFKKVYFLRTGLMALFLGAKNAVIL
jgi:hypothetical protein